MQLRGTLVVSLAVALGLVAAMRAADRLERVPTPATLPPAVSADPGSPIAPSQVDDAASPSDAALSPEMLLLRDRLRDVVAHFATRYLNTRDHDAWQTMHAVIAYGVNTQIRIGGPQGDLQSAVGVLCYNRPYQGRYILTLRDGRPYGVRGVGLQGHHGQLLAILAQSRLQRDYPLLVGGKSFTLEDLIESEKLTCRAGEELTFKLIGLAHYLPSDARWRNESGEEWTISRLVREEIKSPIQGAACGGTHRLMGLSYAVQRRIKQGMPVDGEFARAAKYTADYHTYAFKLQNADGSFSTQWLEYPQARTDLERRLQTSGHILEWLAYSLPDEELSSPQMVRAVAYLTGLLYSSKNRDWEVGALGHGLHALILYDQRMFNGKNPPQNPTAELAYKKPPRLQR